MLFKKNLKFASFMAVTVFLTLGLSISFSSLLAAWTAPTAAPPAGNTAPLIYNESATPATSALINVPLGVSGNLTVNPGGIITGDGSSITSIDGDNITNGTIDSSEIEDNTLTASDLAPNACGDSELADSPAFVNPTASEPTVNNHVATKEYVDAAIIYPRQCAMTVLTSVGNLGGIAGADAKCQAEFGSDWSFATCGKFLSNAPGVSSFQAWCEDPLCNNDCQDLVLGEWRHANAGGVASYGSTIVAGVAGWVEIFGGNPTDPLAICAVNKHIACCNY